MPRGTQLIELVGFLREEIGRSTDMSVGNDDVPALKRIIRRTQNTLYAKWDWPFLMVKPTIQLQQGQRYYDFPEGLSYDKIQEIVVWWNEQPMPLIRGIGPAQYLILNSEKGQRVDPVRRWDVYDSEFGIPQMEVWPVPASNHQRIQMWGKRNLRPLVKDSDRADLDDDLIVLFAAAEMLMRQEDKDAEAKLAAARDLFEALKADSKSEQRTYAMGRGSGAGSGWPNITNRAIVIVGGGGSGHGT
ncbi:MULTISPECIES: hypothetical protein [Chelatococcus]|uniref:Uncharacterized protein n=1 Tax=Chelatococcus caeni TaxID=1348468 RepID=A0A840BVR5_9HYPH|nr:MULTISPECIES: hypothetical protein [Chelatococcus]ALA16080.1 hypothetical protein AL346_00070 [Chelatococcus sp. CO-6]MBB4017581.1 hypothetical protein [Chelatococcus caeni]